MEHPLWTVLDHQGRSIRWLSRRTKLSEDLFLSVKAGRRRATEDFRQRCADALDLPESVLFLPHAAHEVTDGEAVA